MRLPVLANFDRFSADLEGLRVPWPYLDSRDDGIDEGAAEDDALVTTCTGNMIDPVSLATSLPWRLVTSRAARAATESEPLASRAEVIYWWGQVKAAQHRKKQGGGKHFDLSPLRLTPDAMTELVAGKLRQVDRQLSTMFAGWETWPADAQLALTSWAWAAGAASKYPRMIAALRSRDFATASREIAVYAIVANGEKTEPGTLKERNRRNAHLLRNASDVEKHHHDPEYLYWPSMPCGMPDEPAPADVA
jgi:hypothetical protein